MRSDPVPVTRPTDADPAGVDSWNGVGPRSAVWATARGELRLDRPRVMGILNVTPDSFFDGGLYRDPVAALAHTQRLLEEGADLIDVGGESTRPGARRVSSAEERGRVVPVVRALAHAWPDLLVSVDTTRSDVAAAALDEGAAVVNDVSALRLDPGVAATCAARGAGLVLMHSRGGVDRMASYETAEYGEDPVSEIVAELERALAAARAAGVPDSALVVDPGLGFSKRTQHSVAVLRQLPRVGRLGRPVLIGPSRKRFVGALSGGLPVEDRLPGTIAACVAGLLAGARLFRVHDVGAVRRALDVAEAVAP